MKIPVTIRLDDKNVEKFKKLYPKMIGTFFDNVLELALKDKDLFTKLFFKEI